MVTNDCHGSHPRLNKLNVALATLQQLEKKIQDLRWWLLDVEHQLTRPIIYETCSNAEIQHQLRKQLVNNVINKILNCYWSFVVCFHLSSTASETLARHLVTLYCSVGCSVTSKTMACSLVLSNLVYSNSDFVLLVTRHISVYPKFLVCMKLVISFPYKLYSPTLEFKI